MCYLKWFIVWTAKCFLFKIFKFTLRTYRKHGWFNSITILFFNFIIFQIKYYKFSLKLNTALHYSVSNGNFEIVNLLLDTKVCDVNAQNKAGGYTSIMLAALVPITSEYERMTLKRLFSEGNVNIKSADNGQTALMLAVMHGNKETVSLLLEAGSDCNLQDKEGSTALMAACEHGHIEIVRLLLDNTNCDPDIKDNVKWILVIFLFKKYFKYLITKMK